MTGPTQLCRGFTDDQWKRLEPRLQADDEAAWSCAIDVFERRISERFLAPIEALAEADTHSYVFVAAGAPADCSTLPAHDGTRVTVPGFAILALCCLLIETLQSFRAATAPTAKVAARCSYPAGPCIRPTTSTADRFVAFLRLPAFGGAFAEKAGEKVARDFVNGVRNGILHEAETRGWKVWRDLPGGRILESQDDGYLLSWSNFRRALVKEFGQYAQELRNPAQSALRQRFLKKMRDVVNEC